MIIVFTRHSRDTFVSPSIYSCKLPKTVYSADWKSNGLVASVIVLLHNGLLFKYTVESKWRVWPLFPFCRLSFFVNSASTLGCIRGKVLFMISITGSSMASEQRCGIFLVQSSIDQVFLFFWASLSTTSLILAIRCHTAPCAKNQSCKRSRICLLSDIPEPGYCSSGVGVRR